MEYFFRPERFTLENIHYRKHADMPARHLEEITAKILDQVERRVELENLFPTAPVQSFSIKDLPKSVNHIDEIFEQMIFHALAEQYIGESKAAELMNIPLEFFRSLRAMESQDISHRQL